MNTHYLDPLFHPQSIAVVGASDNPQNIGHTVFAQLLAYSSHDVVIHPVNLRHNMVGGIAAVNSITALKERPDLVIITTARSTYLNILKDCHRIGTNYVLMIQANDDLRVNDDEALLKEALAFAKANKIRVLGPTAFGLCRPSLFNATTSHSRVSAGNVALVCQSAAIGNTMMEWAADKSMGFSTVLSLAENPLADVGFGDILDFLIHDRETEGILLHIQKINDARSFMSALRAAALVKPVIVMKSGRFTANQPNSALHVGEVINAETVFSNVLSRAGILQVTNFAQMFAAARTLAAAYRTEGNHLAVIANGNGMGILAADAAMDNHIELTAFSEKTYKLLNKNITENVANPLILPADTGALRFRSATQLCLNDANVHGVLVIFSPNANPQENLRTAEMMVQLQQETHKPLLLCWLGDEEAHAAHEVFMKHHSLHFRVPEYAVEVFATLARFHANQQQARQLAKPLSSAKESIDFQQVRQLLDKARQENIYILPEHLSKKLLGLFHISCNYTAIAKSEAEALSLAKTIGYPIVMKIDSPHIFHKANVGGVCLNINNDEACKEAYDTIMEHSMVMAPGALINGVSIQSMLSLRHSREVKITVSRDAVFGPVITFGAGGDLAVQQDIAMAIPPLNAHQIDLLINSVRISQSFGHYKNMDPIDQDALRSILRYLSYLIAEVPEMNELKMDVLLAPQGAIVMDARVALSPPMTQQNTKRYEHMAIMPYPRYLEKHITLKNGSDALIRPSREEDADLIQNFVRNLSEESRYNRFMSNIKELSENTLLRFSKIDYDREMALLMVHIDENGQEIMLGSSRYATDPDQKVCEFAVSVADNWQGLGIGSMLMIHLFKAARDQGLLIMRGEVLVNNDGMLKMMTKLGFTHRLSEEDDSIMLVEKDLWTDESSAPTPPKKKKKIIRHSKRSNNPL